MDRTQKMAKALLVFITLLSFSLDGSAQSNRLSTEIKSVTLKGETGKVNVGELGVLNVESGTSFFSKYHQQQVLSNFTFDEEAKINVKAQGHICIQTGTNPPISQFRITQMSNMTFSTGVLDALRNVLRVTYSKDR